MKSPAEIPEADGCHPSDPKPGACPPRIRRSTEEAKAARKIGFGTVRISDFKVQQICGRSLTDAGCIELARGLYIGNLKATQNAIENLSKALLKVMEDPDRVIAIAKVQVQLLELHAETANKLDISGSKNNHSDAPKEGSKQPPMMPQRASPTINIAIQNNAPKDHEQKLHPERDHKPASISG